jgi:DNA polymerase-3 subunit epsilon
MTIASNGLAVIDVETTGLQPPYHRIAEIAVVILDPITLEVVDEFDSLVNPHRDLTEASAIHGISASMVSAAPDFSLIAPQISRLLSGCTLVAHNLPFDQMFLESEFGRLNINFDFGAGFDTYRMTRLNLATACDSLGIVLENAHRALADARACASLVQKLFAIGDIPASRPAYVDPIEGSAPIRTLRREQLGEVSIKPLIVPPLRFSIPSETEASLSYLHVLDRYLCDGDLSDQELEDLAKFAAFLGISEETPKLHLQYFGNAVAAAADDGDVNPVEQDYLARLANNLDISMSDFHLPQRQTVDLQSLEPGVRICFTGTTKAEEETLYAICISHGHVPVENVTKKGCDVLVCVDASTGSRKADTARKFGLHIVSVEEFLERFGAQ